MTSTTAQEISITPSEFDPSRLVVRKPLTVTTKYGKSSTSGIFYKNDQDQECKLYIVCPTQKCFLNYKYAMSIKDPKTASPSDRKGVQIAYPATSLETVKNPTEDEQAFMDCISSIWDACKDVLIEFKDEVDEEGESILPNATLNSLNGALGHKSKDLKRALKYPLEHPNIGKTKNPDLSKPQRMYVPLFTRGDGETMTILTKCYGPGDKQVSVHRYVEQLCEVTPCLLVQEIWYGQHGPNPQGASIHFKVDEMNIAPASGGVSVSQTRKLAKNTSTAPEPDSDQDDRHADVQEDDGEEEASATNETPADILNKASGAKPPAAKSKPAVKTAPPKPSAAKPVVKTAPPKAKPAAPAVKAVPPKAKPAAAPVSKKTVVAAGKPIPTTAKKLPVKKPAPAPVEEEEEQKEEDQDD